VIIYLYKKEKIRKFLPVKINSKFTSFDSKRVATIFLNKTSDFSHKDGSKCFVPDFEKF